MSCVLNFVRYHSVGNQESSVQVHDDIANQIFQFPFSQDTSIGDLISSRNGEHDYLAFFENRCLDNSTLLSGLNVSDDGKIVLKKFHI